MINIFEVTETNKMVEKENLDVRTITLGISLLNCIDDNLEKLNEKIYKIVSKIPYGKVATYGQIATLCGNPYYARAVGNALHKNPNPQKIPCYRVVNSKGKLTENFAFGGLRVQSDLLISEGIEVIDGKVDLEKYQWRG